jgi:tetratricopeptide (TPR) repeat protein
MSEHDHPKAHDEAILDANIERLLGHARERPEVPSEARARMLTRLRETVIAGEASEAERDQGRGLGGAGGSPTKVLPLRRRHFTALAALTAVAAALLLAWILGLGERLLDGGETTTIATHEHDERGARAVELGDGSTALLRSGTTLEELGPRHLRLVTGEILLEVREAAEPLLVETPQGRAIVLGTRVLLRSDGVATLAAVLRGEATVETEGAASSLLLRAGEQALLKASTAPERIAGRRLSFEIDWARELLAPESEPGPVRRGNLIARVPRWTGQLGHSAEWPLPVRELVVDVHVEDGHVRTTIDQTFFNHLERDLEGVYQFPLPPRAAISRLAMYVDGQRMEAGVVARDRGRDIYEQIVHRRRDPALLEWMQGNLFQVRIFPLPARTEKRILLSYTASLDELYDRGELRVPIPELDLPVGRVRYRVRVVDGVGQDFSSRSHAFELREEGEDLIAEFEAVDHAIGADIVASLAAGEPTTIERHSLAHADGRRHLGLRVRPDLRAELEALGEQASSAPARDVVVLFDSSASRNPAQLEAQRQFVLALLEHLDSDDRLALLRFDSQLQWARPELERVASLDREALASFLNQAKVGIGATDLGAAVDAGLEHLAAAPPVEHDARERVPTLLYLGDGLAQDPSLEGASAPRAHVQAIAERLRGRASFLAASFGPAYDAPALERLAAAGEGLHVHVAEGESVSWRALELVSTLATERVLELETTLVDAQGRAIAESRTHADRRSLAEGETLEILAELGPEDPEPVALELRGQAKQGEWSQRYELPSPSPSTKTDARWLPRAWAQAHVAALTEDGVEANAAEITKLGLEHFLVTPTTSLLVLENERMYRNFDVHRPPEDAWARYPAPERVEVVRESASTAAGHGQYVVRTPVQMVLDASRQQGPLFGARGRSRWAGVPLAATEEIGIGGLGLVGTGRGGGGTGFGFGLSGEGTIGLGNTGLIGKGGGSGSGSGYGEATKATKFKARDEHASGRFGGFVRHNRGPTSWSTNRQQAAFDDLADVSLAEARFSSTIVRGAAGLDLDASLANAQPYPSARSTSWDPSLDDLGELAPALYESEYDLARERLLLSGLDGRRGSVSEPAAELIAAARAAQADVRYALPEGGTLDIDARGRFAVHDERWGFLDEEVIYDGERLRADYPELGLSVARAVGPTSPALLSEWIPWLVPPAEHLAHFYEVERVGPRSLSLTPITPAPTGDQGPTPRLLVELDADDRVIALRTYLGSEVISTSEFRWTAQGVTMILDGRERSLRRLGPSAPEAFAKLDSPAATLVELPLASPADLELELAEHEPGSEAWIRLQHQRLAGYAALASDHELLGVLESLAEHAGRVLPGELVLGGRALQWAEPKARAAILDAAEDGPVRDYLRARGRGRMSSLAKRSELHKTPVGFMASYRVLLHDAESGTGNAAFGRLQDFLARYEHPDYAYVAVARLNNRWWSKYELRRDAWLALAEQAPRYAYTALHQAGLAAYQRGRYEEAAEIFIRSLERARADETLAVVDWSVQWAITQSRGEAAWQLSWSRMRKRVIDSGDPRLALRFLAIASQLGYADEAQRVLATLEPEAIEPALALRLFDTLVAHGRMSEASVVLDALRRRPQLRGNAAVLVRAAALAEQQGRLDDAALALEQAMVRELEGEGMTLAELRSGFARLFELRARLAEPLGSPAGERDAALARALAVADRWRLEDPDNPEIDRLCAELLWSLGHDDRAWRQLASILDRHAAEGEALAWLADALERGGKLDRADAVWARAIAVEPTDPIHRLRRAQNLLATGDEAGARALLEEVEAGEWQPRFSFTVHQAERLTKSLDHLE